MNEVIMFASGYVSLDRSERALYGNDLRLPLTQNRFNVIEPLALKLGELVTLDELIDATDPGVSHRHQRYMQSIRVQNYIAGLRATLDKFYSGLGSADDGALQNIHGQGYYLREHWQPVGLSTETDGDFDLNSST